jgi:hypothetical protein
MIRLKTDRFMLAAWGVLAIPSFMPWLGAEILI